MPFEVIYRYNSSMRSVIRVAILDDHPAIIDGYLYRLTKSRDIEVVATLHYGSELNPTLERCSIDILILDIQIPVSPTNLTPYPVLNELPRILQSYPELQVLVISMHAQPTLIRAVMDAGASGYILKEDILAFRELPSIIYNIYNQGIFLSPAADQALVDRKSGELSRALSNRQQEALSLCSANPGASTFELARQMGIAHSTFRNFLSGAYLKLGVRNRTAAVLRAEQLGLIAPVSSEVTPETE